MLMKHRCFKCDVFFFIDDRYGYYHRYRTSMFCFDVPPLQKICRPFDDYANGIDGLSKEYELFLDSERLCGTMNKRNPNNYINKIIIHKEEIGTLFILHKKCCVSSTFASNYHNF